MLFYVHKVKEVSIDGIYYIKTTNITYTVLCKSYVAHTWKGFPVFILYLFIILFDEEGDVNFIVLKKDEFNAFWSTYGWCELRT